MKECLKRGVNIISSMGAANKTDPTRFKIDDISKTHTDPIAKVVRTRLRKEGIRKGIEVIFSDESPIVIREDVRKKLEMMKRRFARHKCRHHPMHSFRLLPD